MGDGTASIVVGLGMAVTLTLVGQIGWTLTFGFYGIIVLATALICYFLVRENMDIVNDELANKADDNKLVDLLKAIFQNKYACLSFFYILLVQIGSGSLTAGLTYFFTYVYGDADAMMPVMLVSVILSLAGMIIGSFLVKRIGTPKIFLLGCGGAVVSYLILLISGCQNYLILMVFIPLAAMFDQTFTMPQCSAFASSAVLYGEYKKGKRNEGIISSVINISIKVGGAIATGILGLIMSIGGYVEGGVEQTVGAVISIKAAFLGVPAIVTAILFVLFLLTYKFEKIRPEIDRALAERKKSS